MLSLINKKNLAALALICIGIVHNAFAQNQSTTKIPSAPPVESNGSVQGLQVAVVAPILNYNISETVLRGGKLKSASGQIDQAGGFSIGYARIPIQNVGWDAQAVYTNIRNGDASSDIIRIEANLDYAFNNKLHLKGGLNGSKFIAGTDDEKSLDTGLGSQAGISIQLAKTFSVDAIYVQMNQSGTTDTAKWNADEAGVQLGLKGTF